VILLLLGLAMGLPTMWLYSRLVKLSELSLLKTKKRQLMRSALSHTGSFSELMLLQKHILRLSFIHLQRVFFPALISTLPLVVFLFIKPEFATAYFAGGILLAYLFAKWQWKI
jgi:hypothetical protein